MKQRLAHYDLFTIGKILQQYPIPTPRGKKQGKETFVTLARFRSTYKYTFHRWSFPSGSFYTRPGVNLLVCWRTIPTTYPSAPCKTLSSWRVNVVEQFRLGASSLSPHEITSCSSWRTNVRASKRENRGGKKRKKEIEAKNFPPLLNYCIQSAQISALTFVVWNNFSGKLQYFGDSIGR